MGVTPLAHHAARLRRPPRHTCRAGGWPGHPSLEREHVTWPTHEPQLPERLHDCSKNVVSTLNYCSFKSTTSSKLYSDATCAPKDPIAAPGGAGGGRAASTTRKPEGQRRKARLRGSGKAAWGSENLQDERFHGKKPQHLKTLNSFLIKLINGILK